MKTAMQGTSLRTYFDDVLPEIDGKRREVLRVLIDDQTMDFTNMELAEELVWSINRVTPRVFELRGRDKRFPLRRPILVESRRRRCNVTGTTAIAWQINPELHPGGYKID